MKATIHIHKLSLAAIIGTTPQERKKKQTLSLDLSFQYNAAKAIQTDNLHDAIDYESLVKTIARKVKHSQFFLIEGLAEFILCLIMKNRKIQKAEVVLHKPSALKGAQGVSVRLNKENRAR